MNLNMWGDFQICICLPLSYDYEGSSLFEIMIFILQDYDNSTQHDS